jgi:hypothetical protein
LYGIQGDEGIDLGVKKDKRFPAKKRDSRESKSSKTEFVRFSILESELNDRSKVWRETNPLSESCSIEDIKLLDKLRDSS